MSTPKPPTDQKSTDAAKEDTEISYANFAVVDRGVCVWAKDIVRENIRYLQGLDPAFFVHMGNAHDLTQRPPEAAEAEVATHHQATALRLTCGIATETLFALLGAALQAPYCVFGWMSLYRNKELVDLVERVHTGKPLRVIRPFQPPSWEKIAATIYSPLPGGSPVPQQFAQAWSRMAEDYLSDHTRDVHNSLKHGLRVAAGGFSVTATVEDRSVTFTNETSHSYVSLRPIGKSKNHYAIRRTAVPTDAGRDQAALSIVTASLSNVIAFLRAQAQEESFEPRLLIPDPDLFELFAKPGRGVKSFSFGENIEPRPEEMLSSEEILSIYDD